MAPLPDMGERGLVFWGRFTPYPRLRKSGSRPLVGNSE